jgi:hypothetical protein
LNVLFEFVSQMFPYFNAAVKGYMGNVITQNTFTSRKILGESAALEN